MGKRAIALIFAAGFILGSYLIQEAFAGQGTRSGSYQGRKTSGTFQQKVNRGKGQRSEDATWQNQNGEGSRQFQTNWNKSAGTGSYSSTATSTTGKASSRAGTVTRNEPGSFSQQGTITTADGKTIAIQGTSTINEDGSRSVSKTFTGTEVKTLNVDKTIIKTDTGRTAAGIYSTSTGKSGHFESTETVSGGKVTKDQTLTNQDQKIWQRNMQTTGDGQTVTRDVTSTNSEGKTDSYTESVTFDVPAGQK